MKKQLLSFFLILLFFISIVVVTDAGAIPAFARRYKISCTTCHTPFPKLKPYGDEFAGNGFILKENENPRDYISAGDDMLWLNRTFPIAVRFDAYGVYEPDNKVETDFQSPWGLKLLSGGTLAKGIGYYFYFFMSERGEIAGIEDAYIHFDNVFGTNLDIMVGQFQTSDPIWKRELRLTFEDYTILKQRFGPSQTNLTYERGVTLTYGIEKTGTDFVAMVANGNGKVEAGEDTKFDDNSAKNYGIRISQGLGERVSVGGFFYNGREKILHNDPSSFYYTDEITYWGPDVKLSFGPINVAAQYLKRKDSKILSEYATGFDNPETDGYIFELTYSPRLDRSRIFYTLLYNRIKHKYSIFNYETTTVNANFLIARNLKIIGEYTRDMQMNENRFILGLVSAF